MKKTLPLIFEKSVEGRRTHYLSECETPVFELPASMLRHEKLDLPEMAETDITRHYTALESRTFGINDGFYPLGSCTMKYNPKINDKVASISGFADIHPLQGDDSTQGVLEALHFAGELFAEITGMDHITFQPAAGAHGELASIMMFKKYFEDRGENDRKKVIVPDSAHGTNPATVHMCGMEVINLTSSSDGIVDLDALKEVVAANTGKIAGIMMTNPNTLGMFERDVLEITKLIHAEGGLCYYDGANLNAIAGVVRPGDMGFDCVHLNLHKTFSTPHGGGGPGSGASGCKEFLRKYLPSPHIVKKENGHYALIGDDTSIGQILAFYGNTLISLRALAFVMAYGSDYTHLMSKNAVLNANYLKHRLAERFEIFNKGLCMHEFIITMEQEAKQHFTAKDMAKAILDEGMMSPTMYFPLIVKEALMVEPTETEGKETLDLVADTYIKIYDEVAKNPELATKFPLNAVISRPDELEAARTPVIRYVRP